MAKAFQLALALDNKPGTLARLCRHLADGGVNLLGLSAPEELARGAVRQLCDSFPGEYWQGLEPSTYPTEFVQALTDHGWLAALVPEEYGGSGLSITYGGAILEEICASGGNAGACHAQMYTMGTILRHSSATCPRSPKGRCACRPSP